MDANDEKILDRMREFGLEVVWEHPGVAVINVTDHTEVWTGLNGWEYGTIVVNGEPLEESARPFALREGDTDPDKIARCWSHWVNNARLLGLRG